MSIIRSSYSGMSNRVVLDGKTSESFNVLTGVRKGCLLSPFLFLLAIDWIMHETTVNKRNGIHWSISSQLDDLDFADDLALLSHTYSQMLEKTSVLDTTAQQVGLNIHRRKTKVSRMNTANTNPIPLRGEPIEDVDSFTYLGSIVSKTRGTDEDVKARIQKASKAFLMMKNIWKSGNIRLQTKLRLFNSNVRSVLLYGSETWRTNKYTIQTFVNKCLRWILGIRWFDKVTNVELWRRSQQEPVSDIIRRRKWRWTGHTLRKPVTDITRHALSWNPAGKRRRGRPRNTWQRSVKDETKKVDKSWPQLRKLTKNG